MAHPYEHATPVPAGPLDLGALVPGEGPCDLELGFGRADFLLERARRHPERRLLGLEVRLKWVALAEEKLAARGLTNARAYAADALRTLGRIEGAAVFETIFLHFPDPWWKRRHERRLLVAPDMLAQFERLLTTGGLLFIQTDVPDRARAYRELLLSAPGFSDAGPVDENPFGIASHREKKCIQAGLPIHRLLFRGRG
ncbi:MAG: tRNA (guanine-N7)-methyltransferase [Deltaproteobacteria bacterium]|nr:tRNA (guanine-N7)-methyltransferase [Deltaproteobacteria bacterium]